MKKNDDIKEKYNLIGGFSSKKSPEFKGSYTRMFPTKLSSSSFLELYTLQILNKKPGPVYGFEILKEINKSLTDSAWNPSHGTLYPALSRLENRGSVKGTKENESNPKSKTYWEITDAGRIELDHQIDSFKEALISSNNFFSKVVENLY